MKERSIGLGALALAVLMFGATGCLRVREDGAAAAISRAEIGGTPVATIVATDTPAAGGAATAAPAQASATAVPAETATAAPAQPSATAVPASATTAPTGATPSPTAAETPVVLSFNGGAGGRNQVQIVNKNSGVLRVAGRVDYGHAKGPKVGPENAAVAYASCADCQTFAVALQVVLYRQGATQVTPRNQAVAVNVQCSRCLTVARAIQYVIPVEDPINPPENVRALVRALDDEMRAIERDQASLTVAQADARIDAVIDRFRELGTALVQQRDQQAEPTTGTLPSGA